MAIYAIQMSRILNIPDLPTEIPVTLNKNLVFWWKKAIPFGKASAIVFDSMHQNEIIAF